MKKNILEKIRFVALALVFSLGIGVAFAWTGPTSTAPSSNVSAPLNVSSAPQIKTGNLWLSGLDASGAAYANGLVVEHGNVGIGAANPGLGKLWIDGGDLWLNGDGRKIAFSTDGSVDTTPNATILAKINNYSNAATDFIFDLWNGSADTEIMRMKSNGNVGIGTTVPNSTLDVNGTIAAKNTISTEGAISAKGSISADGTVYAKGGYLGIFPDYANGETESAGVTYQAAVNGYLSVVAVGSYMNNLEIEVGSTDSLGIVVWRMGDDLNSYTKGGSAMIPVKKGVYYRVSSPGSAWVAQYPYESIQMIFFPADSSVAFTNSSTKSLKGTLMRRDAYTIHTNNWVEDDTCDGSTAEYACPTNYNSAGSWTSQAKSTGSYSCYDRVYTGAKIGAFFQPGHTDVVSCTYYQ